MDYLKSEEWKKKSKMRKNYDNNRCQNCGQEIKLNTHHLDYDNIYNEDVKRNLKTLCVDCHRKIHLLKKRKRRSDGTIIITEFS